MGHSSPPGTSERCKTSTSHSYPYIFHITRIHFLDSSPLPPVSPQNDWFNNAATARRESGVYLAIDSSCFVFGLGCAYEATKSLNNELLNPHTTTSTTSSSSSSAPAPAPHAHTNSFTTSSATSSATTSAPGAPSSPAPLSIPLPTLTRSATLGLAHKSPCSHCVTRPDYDVKAFFDTHYAHLIAPDAPVEALLALRPRVNNSPDLVPIPAFFPTPYGSSTTQWMVDRTDLENIQQQRPLAAPVQLYVQCGSAYCDAVPVQDACALGCGHWFCQDCWGGFLQNEVSAGGRQSLFTQCMGMACTVEHNHKHGCKCTALVPLHVFGRFLSPSSVQAPITVRIASFCDLLCHFIGFEQLLDDTFPLYPFPITLVSLIPSRHKSPSSTRCPRATSPRCCGGRSTSSSSTRARRRSAGAPTLAARPCPRPTFPTRWWT